MKKPDDLRGVEQTMLLPLWGRYTESKKEQGLIRDLKCVEIVERLGLDFSTIEREQNPATRLAWVARAWNVDKELGSLLAPGTEVTVLCLGCGLDTAFYRIGSPALNWYDLDLPAVIEIRRSLMGEVPGCRLVAGSVLDPATFEGVEIRGTLVVVAVGLLYYFEEAQVRRVFHNLARLARGTRVVIDYCSSRGVEMANRLVLKSCTGARMTWAADTEDQLRGLHQGIRGLQTYPLFRNLLPLLAGEQAKMATMSDQLGIMSFAIMDLE